MAGRRWEVGGGRWEPATDVARWAKGERGRKMAAAASESRRGEGVSC